jgi:hypothetical protein
MSISEDMSKWIGEQIENYRKKPFGPLPHQLVLLQLGVLPLSFGIDGGHGIRIDGEIIKYLVEDPQAWDIESDERIRNIVLFQGSKLYEKMSELLPRRNSTSQICLQCNGSGVPIGISAQEQANVICYCGGLGWIP